MNRFGLVLILLWSGCASIITKEKLPLAQVVKQECGPFALTVVKRLQVPGPAYNWRVRFLNEPEYEQMVRDAFLEAGCSNVEMRPLRAAEIAFADQIVELGDSGPEHIVEAQSAAAPSATPDEMFRSYLLKSYPEVKTPWLVVMSRERVDYVGHHLPLYVGLIHVLSLGLIPIWSNEEVQIQSEFLNRSPAMQLAENGATLWAWSPFLLRSDDRTYVDSQMELKRRTVRTAVVKMVGEM